MNGGRAPVTYNQFQRIIQMMDPPDQAIPTITLAMLTYCHTPIYDDHDDKYGIPTLDELGKYEQGV